MMALKSPAGAARPAAGGTPTTGGDAAMTCAILALGLCLAFTGFSFLGAWSPAPHGRILGFEEGLGALAAGAGVAISLWWAVALACALVAGLAERHGRTALASTMRHWSPLFMRRLVLTVLGVNLLAAPLPALAGSPSTGWAHPASSGTVATAPLRGGPAVETPDPGPIDPLWEPSTMWKPALPAVDPGPVVPAPSRPDPERRDGPAPARHTVVVKAGDSLWTIAARELGPYATDVEVAQSWPQWYRANRNAIGPDPNLIAPGLILHAPDQ